MPYPNFAAGQIVTADDLAALRPIYKVKPANESRQNTVTVSNDADLFVALEANSQYLINLHIQYYGTTGSQGIRTAWTIPAGATLDALRMVLGPNSGSTDRNNTTVRQSAHGESTEATQGSDDGSGFWATSWERFIITTTSAGTLQLQWAQLTSSAGLTEIRSGSWLSAELIG